MRDRTQEYWELVGELSQPPQALEGSVERARRRARRAAPLRRLAAPAASLAAVAATFVLLVNVFPAFALACSGVPIIRELTAAVAFSPSLSAAVAHDYVQYIGQSQTVDGVTVDLEYAIVDKHQAVFFYSTDTNTRLDNSPRVTTPDGEGIGGYASSHSSSSDPSNRKELSSMTLSFTAGNSLPERFTLELFLKPRPEADQAEAPASVYAPEDVEAPVAPWEEPDTLRFAFDIILDPARINDGKTVEVGQWVELDGQRILVDRLEYFPTRTILYLGEDSANTAWLRSLKFWFEDGKGSRYDNKDGVLSASGKEDSQSYLTYYFQSFYYNEPKSLTLCVGAAEWLEKDKTRVFLDLTTGECTGLPDGVRIDSITPSSNGRTVVARLMSPLERKEFGQTFGTFYWDPEGNEHTFDQWGGGSEWNEEGEEIGTYELVYFHDYPWDTAELELSYTSVSVYEDPIGIPLF